MAGPFKYCVLSSVMLLCVRSAVSFPGNPSLFLCQRSSPGNSEVLLDCMVPSGHLLDYRDIRKLTSLSTGNQKYNVTIMCQGGRIYLPFPFRAENIISLSVYSCSIEGYFAERETTVQIYPNELKNVSIVNAQIVFSTKEVLEMVSTTDTISRDFTCGQTNARTEIFKNVHYVFPDFTSMRDNLLLMEALLNSDLEQMLMQPKYQCMYPYLDYLEMSGSRSLSRSYFKLFENNQYPQLRHFVLRNNSLTKIPQEIGHLNVGLLPNLEVLDLSNNEIVQLELLFQGADFREKVLYVDLRGNKIELLSSSCVERVVKTRKVILDIRDNPLRCACELNIYKTYLLQYGGPDARFLADIVCTTEERGVTKTYNILDADFGRRFCSPLPPQVAPNLAQSEPYPSINQLMP